MALGIVSDEDFLKELGDSIESESQPIAEVRDSNLGRGNGNNEVPDSLKKIIGETAIESGRQDALALANNLGISPSSVSAYTNGATSTATYHKPSSELKSHLAKTKQRITKKAVSKLNSALEQITDEKLGATKARDLAAIAKDMSAIVKNMEPEVEKNNQSNIQNNFVLMAPPSLTEDKFDYIQVNE